MADILVALIVLILLSPLLIVLTPFLLLTGEGYVFYQQERIGWKNQPFKILKFATMLKDSPNMKGGEITQRGDPRITPMGRILRPAKLDELPQVTNILKGDMSWVGPRPLMPVSFKEYTPEVQAVIYQVRPGLTGIGSIVFRDEEKWVTESQLPPKEFYRQHIFPYKGKVEMWYQENRSFYLDFMILLLTAYTLFVPENNLIYKFFPSLPPLPETFISPPKKN